MRGACVVWAVVGNVIACMGHNLQRNVHNGLKNAQHPQRNQFLRVGGWWAGFLLILLGETGNFVAYGFAPVALIAPLGAVGMIFNALLAHLWHREPYHRFEVYGLSAICTGTLIMLAGAPKETRGLMGELMSEFTFSPPFYVCMSSFLIAFISLGLAVNAETKRRNLLVWLIMSALMGALTVMFAKTLAFAVFSTVMGSNAFHWPTTWLSFFFFLIALTLQSICVTQGMQVFPSCAFVPAHFALFTILTIGTSMVLLKEVLTVWTANAFVFFTVTSLGGVFCFLYLHRMLSSMTLAETASVRHGRRDFAEYPLLNGKGDAVDDFHSESL